MRLQSGRLWSDEGIDEVKDIFKNAPDILGPLDENEPEGEDLDDEAGDDNEEIGVKFPPRDLQGFGVKFCRDWGKEGDQRLGKMVLL